ncbi:MAG: CCA tRNA nucleotidyltransferase, partial [Syntrophomonadaceae bacterium]|nr:CCA tRNA nucleotidyltransferase [Syntrophomonadaceae bacterium]
LPSELFNMLANAGQIADELGCKAYCVGGFVRDLIMKVKNFDVDLVVEGDGIALARALGENLGGKVRVHERFRTAVVSLAGGYKIDVATARTEFYEFPAALPMVERSSVKEDMYRRDFTINALALQLNADNFGALIDYFGGRRDIENRYIRILYNLSFIEDPTRILRAIRFEQRYQFTIEPDTLRFAIDAIERRLLGKLSYKRILTELILILNEADPVPALFRMRDIGVWKYIFPEIRLERLDPDTLRRIPVLLSWWQSMFMDRPIKSWLVYLQFCFAAISVEEEETVVERYGMERTARRVIAEAREVADILRVIENESAITPGRLDRLLKGFADETMCYLLLNLHDVDKWLLVERYLEERDQARLEINGRDLKALGIIPGPQYKEIMDELHELKLDGVINGRRDEIDRLKMWIEEGRVVTQ